MVVGLLTFVYRGGGAFTELSVVARRRAAMAINNSRKRHVAAAQRTAARRRGRPPKSSRGRGAAYTARSPAVLENMSLRLSGFKNAAIFKRFS